MNITHLGGVLYNIYLKIQKTEIAIKYYNHPVMLSEPY